MDSMPQDARGAVDQTSAAFRSLPVDVQEVMRAVDAEVDAALAALPPEFRQTANEAVRDFDAGISDLDQVTSAAVEDAGEELEGSMTGKAKAAGAAAAAAFAASLALGMTDALSNGGSIARLSAQFDLTEQEAAIAGDTAGQIWAGNFGESVDDVARSMGEVMASLGVDVGAAELDDLTQAAITLADVFDVEVAANARAAGVMVRLGLARDGKEAFNLLAAAGRGLSGEVFDELISAVGEYGTAFAGLGAESEAVFAALRYGAEIQGAVGLDRVGDSLNELSAKMGELDEAALETLGSLGLNAGEVTDAFATGGTAAEEAFEQIIAGLQSIEDPSAQAQAALALFGDPLLMLGQQNIPGFIDALAAGEDALGDTSTAATDMAESLGDHAAAKIEDFKRDVQLYVVDFLTDDVMPVLADASDWLVENFGPAWQRAGELVEDAQPYVEDFIDEIERLLDEHGPELQQLADDLGVSAMTLVTIVGQVAALAAGTWDLFGEDLFGSTVRTFGNIATVVQGGLEIVSGILQIWSSIFTGDWEGVWEGFTTGWGGVWSVIEGIFWQAVELVTAPMRALASALGIDMDELVDDLTGGARDVFTGVTGWFDNMRTAVPYTAGRMKDAAVAKFWELVTWVSGLPSEIRDALGDLSGLLFGIGADIIGGLWDGLQDKWDDVTDWFGDVTDMIPDIKGPPARDRVLLRPAGTLIMDGFLDGLSSREGNLVDRLAGYTDLIEAAGRVGPDSSTIGYSYGTPRSGGDGAAGSGGELVARLSPADIDQLAAAMRAASRADGATQIVLQIGTDELATWFITAEEAAGMQRR